jgi:hypothetical protein
MDFEQDAILNGDDRFGRFTAPLRRLFFMGYRITSECPRQERAHDRPTPELRCIPLKYQLLGML